MSSQNTTASMGAPKDGAARDGDVAATAVDQRPPLLSLDSALFKEVQVDLKAKLGAARLSVEELLALKAGSIVRLDAKMNDPIELRLNDTVVACGEIVAVGDHFAVRIVEVAPAK
jgi:flagellar motor switch protein FliN